MAPELSPSPLHAFARIWLLGLLCACGYPSYYPVEQTRIGGPLDGFIHEGEFPCTTIFGAQPVELTVIASAAVKLAIVTDSCSETPIIDIIAGGSFSAPANPGAVYTVRDPAELLLGWFRVPDTDGQPWLEEVP